MWLPCLKHVVIFDFLTKKYFSGNIKKDQKAPKCSKDREQRKAAIGAFSFCLGDITILKLNQNMSKKAHTRGSRRARIVAPLAAVALIGSTFGLTGNYAAAAPATVSNLFAVSKRARHMPGIIGVVSGVNGSTLTVKALNGSIYTVNAEKAKIVKDKNIETSLATIDTGDKIMVRGEVDGTNVTAEVIREGVFPPGFRRGTHMGHGIRGVVKSIDGTTLSVEGKDGKTYTVDASEAKVYASKANMVNLSEIDEGDTVTIRGSVDGTEVTAKVIFDGLSPRPIKDQ